MTSLALGRRLRAVPPTLAFLVVGLLVAGPYTLVALASAVGLALSPLVVGQPLFKVAALATRACARLERLLANRLLEARILPLPLSRDRRWRAVARRERFLRALALLVLKPGARSPLAAAPSRPR